MKLSNYNRWFDLYLGDELVIEGATIKEIAIYLGCYTYEIMEARKKNITIKGHQLRIAKNGRGGISNKNIVAIDLEKYRKSHNLTYSKIAEELGYGDVYLLHELKQPACTRIMTERIRA